MIRVSSYFWESINVPFPVDAGMHSYAQLIYAITLPVSCAIILINLLIILCITCNRQLHNSQNYFFLSLLVADLCTGVALPFIPWMGLNRPLSFSSCLLVHIFPNFLFLAFLFNLVLVHYERYQSIVSPLQRGQLWLHRRFALPLLAVWMLPLLFALLPAFGWNNKAIHDRNDVFPNAFIYLEVYGLLAPAILSIAAMTCRVLWITREQLRDIQRLQRAVANRECRRRMEMRYACCVAAVSLAFLTCWVPYIVYTHVGVEFLERERRAVFCVLLSLCSAFQHAPAATSALHGTVYGNKQGDSTQYLTIPFFPKIKPLFVSMKISD
uniref:G-protein coupled receptors family 1 profile domain-containing protein n=1 Tax=Sinocyclocheilus grahami TaxID=75366 RepID=A0A672LRH6_SINGR